MIDATSDEPPQLAALTTMQNIVSNINSLTSDGQKLLIAKDLRKLLSLAVCTPNKYNLSADANSISKLIDELSKPKCDASEIGFVLQGRIEGLEMRIFEMLRHQEPEI